MAAPSFPDCFLWAVTGDLAWFSRLGGLREGIVCFRLRAVQAGEGGGGGAVWEVWIVFKASGPQFAAEQALAQASKSRLNVPCGIWCGTRAV